ncbi:AmmeMemoRadiSam system protein B [Candidatus Parcubacteria bacterium]|nr:MAG: AmmeMemoRadiSam system protein B [Candidatus Parcubacteria bacterium]
MSSLCFRFGEIAAGDICYNEKMRGTKIKITTLAFGALLIILISISASDKILHLQSFFSRETIISKSEERFPIVSGVVPHHLLAKDIIQNFFEHIFSKERPESIILLSPDHVGVGTLCGINSFITLDPQTGSFQGLKVANSLLGRLRSQTDFCFHKDFVATDHGIVNLLPYISTYSPETKILPILVPSDVSEEQIALLTRMLHFQASPKTVVVASVDFSHYLPKNVAEFHDKKSIRVLLNFEKNAFENLEVDCWQCLYGARLFARLRNKERAETIRYGNSADFLKRERVAATTSYFSVAFGERGENFSEQKEKQITTLLFVGDIMLDRDVERLMNKNNKFWPFRKISRFLEGVDVVIGNLEGPVVKHPPNFGNYSLKFAFSPESVEALSLAHFGLVSLANNHTLDMGVHGFEETKELLTRANIGFVGHPTCGENFSFERREVVFLAFNKIFPFNCPNEKIVKIVEEARKSSQGKFLVVIFHWGKEYQLQSSVSQQELAHQVIDSGADLIIGSHPHVIQEVEQYKGKLIFYSLGNFVFDQYFSNETQQGLAVGVEISLDGVTYRLFPIRSESSQPFLMEQKWSRHFLEKLASRSFPQPFGKLESGIIKAER